MSQVYTKDGNFPSFRLFHYLIQPRHLDENLGNMIGGKVQVIEMRVMRT